MNFFGGRFKKGEISSSEVVNGDGATEPFVAMVDTVDTGNCATVAAGMP